MTKLSPIRRWERSGSASIHGWSSRRWEEGTFVEDESYKWRDAAVDRRLGVKRRNTKYFILYREVLYKQREDCYWIERTRGWWLKIPFCKTYEETKIGNWILIDLPIVGFYIWIIFSRS